MSRAHGVVVDPARRTAELEAYNRLAAAAPLPLTYHLPQLMGPASLASEPAAAIRAIIVLGSASSVHEDAPWQRALAAWLRPLIAAGVPVLGICYGHQLLAAMYGGWVDYAYPDGSSYGGTRQLTFVDDDALPETWRGARGPLFVSHQEVVARLPEDFVLAAASSAVAVEAMRHETLPVFGVQAHPEATAAFCARHPVPEDEARRAHEFGHGLVDGFLRWAALRPVSR